VKRQSTSRPFGIAFCCLKSRISTQQAIHDVSVKREVLEGSAEDGESGRATPVFLPARIIGSAGSD